MVLRCGFRPAWVAALAVAIGLWASPVRAADRSDAKGSDKEAVKTVELFAAMEAGDIDVKLIPKDSKQSTVLIENKLDMPLRIKLPDAFAGVHVLGQMGGMGGMGGGMGGMGGGMGGMGGGMGGMGGWAAAKAWAVAWVAWAAAWVAWAMGVAWVAWAVAWAAWAASST